MNFTTFKNGTSKFKNRLHPKTIPPHDAGFTLIELIVIVVIIGILGAIAAPGWVGFMNSRRVNSANDAVLQAINNAKSKARKEKRPYSVSLRTEDNIPQIAVHPARLNPNDVNIDGYWELGDLGNEIGLKPNQIVLQTNLANYNQLAGVAPNTPFTTVADNDTQWNGITFDHTGELREIDGVAPNTNLMIRVGVKNSSNGEPIDSTLRCIEIETLLGSVRIGRTADECQNPTDNS